MNGARYIPRCFASRYIPPLFTSRSGDSCMIFLYYSMLYYKHRHTSPGCHAQQSSILGGSALRSNALTFYTPFLTEEVPFRTSIDKLHPFHVRISFSCCKRLSLEYEKMTKPEGFLYFFTAVKCRKIFSPLGLFIEGNDRFPHFFIYFN